MPLLSIDTNVKLADEDADRFIKTASEQTASMLGKPESYVMVKLEMNPHMSFGGTKEPLVYSELKSLGLPEEKTKEFSATLCELFSKQLDVNPDRVYIEFANGIRHMWGWNNSTF